MTKQSIFPYYTRALSSIDGVKLLDVEGAAMIHFNDIDDEKASELKYPCRIDALIMVVCVRGEISFSSHMNECTLRSNQFYVSSASIFQFHKIADSEFYVMAFSSEFLAAMNIDVRFVARIMAQFRNRSHIMHMSDVHMAGMARFFDVLHTETNAKERTEYTELSLRHTLCAIIYRICDVIMDRDDVIPSIGVKERSSEYFERLMALLSEHYREQRNVEFYAEKMHVSSKHLSRVIRNFTGKSVHQWIDEVVALEIKNLLKYSNMSIQQISYSLNFPNPSFMGQYFKRITGMTPGEYKRS